MNMAEIKFGKKPYIATVSEGAGVKFGEVYKEHASLFDQGSKLGFYFKCNGKTL